MLRKLLLGSIVCLVFLFSSFVTGSHKHSYKIKTIVIDAGHGGHDSGCLGSSGKEKHVALDVALKLGKLIEEKFPEINVIYTRKTDVFVELHERAEIANRSKADLFICIHCNSGGPSAFGAETYVMGLHKTDDNLNVARRENSSVLLEKDYKQKYDGFDPNSPEANIIFSLYQNAFLSQSLKLASLVQNQFEEYAGRYNRGVKQAGFLVLYRTTMPSLLIETGFLTNKTEEKYLLSDKGQSTIATAIYRAFYEYKVDMETGSQEAEAPVVPKNDAPKNLPAVKPEEKKEIEEPKFETPKPESIPVKKTEKEVEIEKDTTEKPAESKPIAKQPEENKTAETNEAPKVVTEKIKEEPKPETKIAESKQPDLIFTVQLGAIHEETKKEMSRFIGVSGVRTIKGDDGLIRVVSGTHTSYSKATAAQNVIRKQGFADAFVTAYFKGKRITIKEAQEIKK